MNSKIKKIISAKSWEFYLSRPFTVFGASFWQHWYNSEEALICVGTKSPDVLFLEEEKNVARCYRPKEQQEKLNRSAGKVIFDSKRAVKLMKEGLEYNRRAVRVLEGKEKFRSAKEGFDFIVAMALRSTVLPYRVGGVMGKQKKLNSEVLRLMKKLRAISYYPRVLEEIVMPMMKNELRTAGVKDPGEVSQLLTYSEFVKGNYKVPAARYKLLKNNYFYLLSEVNNKQEVNIVSKSLDLMKKLEPGLNFAQIKGSVAFAGKITGRVKLVNARTIKEVRFQTGEILVSVSTSPIYLPFMKKAAAIVTDEGGLTSHAAILARELKKPTLIGTRIASKVLKNGDLVEVDANKGIVRLASSQKLDSESRRVRKIK